MSEQLGDAELTINTVDRGFRSGISEAKKLAEAFVDSVTGKIKFAVGAVDGFITALGKIGLAAQGIKALSNSMVGLGQALLSGNAALEMTTISFKTLLGSAAAADDMIKQLTQFAANTPFELAGLEANTQKLLAFGFGAKDIIPLMTSMGDAISALGGTQENLDSLVRVMGQMRQEAHINAGDIMQMVNLGIPALQMLADHYHVTTSEIQEMITKGLIPGTAAVDIFTKSLEQKYGGMMAAQSSTFSGMMSNLHDWAAATMITLSKPFFEPAKRGLKALLDYVQSPAGVNAVNKLAAAIQKGVDWATAAFIRSIPHIKEWFGGLRDTYELVMSRLTPGVTGLANRIEALWHKWQPLIKTIWDTYKAFSPFGIALATIKGFLTGGLPGAIGVLAERFDKLKTIVERFLPAFKNGLAKAFDWFKGQVPNILNGFQKLISTILGWVLPAIPKIVSGLAQVLQIVIAWVKAKAPQILDAVLAWAYAFTEWVKPIVYQLMQSLAGLISVILNWIAQNGPFIATTLLSWGLAFLEWLDPLIPQLLRALSNIIIAIAGWVVDNGPTLLTLFLGWADNILTAIGGIIPNILQALGTLLTSLVGWIQSNGPRILGELLGWAEMFLRWVGPMIPKVLGALGTLIVALANWFATHGPDILAMLVGWGIIFVEWAAGLFVRILPALQTFIGRLLSFLENQGPPLLSKLWGWLQNSGQYVLGMLPSIISAVLGVFESIGAWVTNNAGFILDKFWGFLKWGLDTAAVIMGKVVPVLLGIVEEIGKWMTTNANDILNKFWGFLRNGIDTINGIMGKLGPILGDLMKAVGEWIKRNTPDILDHFWSFLKTAVSTVSQLMVKLGPLLGDIIAGIGGWINTHSAEILDQFWGFIKTGITTIQIIMNKLMPVLADIVVSIGTWVDQHSSEIVSEVFGFLDWAVKNFINLVPKIVPIAVKMMNSLTDEMVKQAPGLISSLASAFLDSVQKHPEAWAKVGEFMIAAMFGPLGIAGAVAIEFLKYKSGGMVGNPIPNGNYPGKIPGFASGGITPYTGVFDIHEKERIFLPEGTRILNAMQTRQMDMVRPSIVNNQNTQTTGDEFHVHLNTQRAEPTIMQDIAIAKAMRRR